MLREHRNKIAMYEAVLTVLDDFQPSWSVLPVFQGIRDNFQEKIVQLQQLDYQQRFMAEHAARGKKLQRAVVAEQADTIRSIVLAYAHVSGNLELQSALRFAASRLRYGSDLEVAAYVNRVLEKATDFLPELAPYGLSQAQIDALVTARDSALILRTEPRERILDRKAITRQIKAEVQVVDRMLAEKIDYLVKALKDVDPDFYLRYLDARKVIDLRGPGRSTETPAA